MDDEEENQEMVDEEGNLPSADELISETAQTPDVTLENLQGDRIETPNDEKISEEEKEEKKEEELDNQWVWYPDDKLVWNRGLVLSSVYVENPKGPGWREYLISISVNPPIVRKIRSDMVHRVDPTHLDDLDNLCLMNDMHEAPLLDLLRRRFERKVIYTYTGDVLISVNPYETIAGLYSNPLGLFNIHAPESATDLVKSGDNEDSLAKPHVYQISNKALRSLIYGNVIEDDCSATQKNRNYFNQSIIISGESGAGKTENSKHVVNFLIEANNFLSHHQSNSTSKEELFAEYLKGILVESSVVLEAFGNAKTVRNDNSSRFGKYIKLLYAATEGKPVANESHGTPTEIPKLISAVIETFLLEKSRLAYIGQGERSYHIFYQLLIGLAGDSSLKDPLGLLDAKSFRMLSQGGCSSTAEDHHEFQNTLKALQVLQCSQAEIIEIWKLLATILHLNNLEFPNNESGEPVKVQSPTYSLAQIAENLGVGLEQMITSLTTQQLIVMKRSSIKVKILSPSDVANNTLALTKWLYSKLFDWIVAKINYCFFTPNNKQTEQSRKEGFIGILDIFGFEILGVNSFEQLCINFTNERLQQQFNEYVFVTEQAMYRKEGLQWSNITFRDNQGVIDLISSTKKPLGLLLLLEEQGLLNRKPDDLALLATFNSIHEVKDAKGRVITEGSIYSKSRFGKDAFTIKHFAGDVTYAVDGFLMKNNDSLQDDLISLLNTSNNPFLRNVMKFSDVTPDQLGFIPGHQAIVAPPPVPAEANVPGNRNSTSASGKKMASAASVSLHFRQQLDTLMTTLTSTTPNYIKCVKPNAMKAQAIFDPQLVIQQLRYSGVLEVVRIRREGFPVRVSFQAFYRDYEILARGKPKHLFPGPDNCTFEQAKVCAGILAAESLPSDAFQIGTSVLFLRQNGLVLMQEAIRHFYSRQLVKIQSKYRAILQRRYYFKQLSWIVKVQKQIRCFLQKQAYRKVRRAALTIKYFYISKRLRQQFVQRYQEILSERRLAAAIRIQCNYRGMQARIAFQKMYKAWMKLRYKSAVLIQCCFRVFSAKKLFAYRVYEVSVTKIQSIVRMHVQRMDYLVVRSIIIALQSILRRFIYRNRYLRMRHQIILIQSLARRRQQLKQYQLDRQHIILVQSVARRYIHQMHYLLQQVSLICLQTWIRSHQIRKQFLTQRSRVIRLQATTRRYLCTQHYRYVRQQVIKVQTIVRSWLHWQRYQLICSATICLQSFTRMVKARRAYYHALVAIITIQTKYRSYFYRRLYKYYRQQIIQIERIMRGYLQRQQYHHQRQSIVKLQSFGRMINCQRQYTEAMINIIIVQSLLRRYLARRYLRFHQAQVTKITKCIRRYLCRRQYRLDYQRVIRLQSFGRMINQRRMYQEMMVSAIIMQTVVRGFLNRQWYLSLRRRIIKFQAMVRRDQQRQQYQIVRQLIIKIQSHARKYIAMMQYAVALVSILCMQAMIRRGTKRLQYLRQKTSAIQVQSHYRRYQAQQRLALAKRAVTKLSSSYRRYQVYHWYQGILRRIRRIQQAIRRFLLNLHLKQRLSKFHDLLMDNLNPSKGPINNGVIQSLGTTTGNKARRRSTNTGSAAAAAAAAAAASHVLPSHEEILANHIKLMNQVLKHLYEHPEDRFIRIRKRSLKTMLHSLLISSNEELLRALSITCTEIFDVDIRGRNSAHYLAMYPSSACLTLLAETVNKFRIPINVTLDVLDFEDDKDDDKETPGTMTTAMTQMKEVLHHSVGNSSLKAGWLKKRRGGMMWQKRWVVLTEDYIIYYKSPQTINNPKYAIPLLGCSVQRLAGSRDPIVEVIAPNMGEKKTLFGSSTKKTMNFLAESEKDLQEWLLPLKAVAGVGTFRSTPPVRYINTDLRKLWLNVTDIENETPLHLLIKSIAGLLRPGVSPSNQEYIEKVLVMEDIIAVICWMIEFGCPVNAQNLRGETALGIAIEANLDPRIVRALLMKGSDPKIANVYEITPYEVIHNNPEKKQLYYEALSHSIGQKGVPAKAISGGNERNYTSMGKLKGYSYLSLYFGQQLFYKASNCSEDPSIAIFVYNEKKQLIEVARDVRNPATIAPDNDGGYIYWGQSWHMQTPLENLEPNSYLMIEYRPRGEAINTNTTANNALPIAALHMMFKIDLNVIDSEHVTFEMTPLLEMHKQLNPILLQQEKSSLQAELILTQRNRVVDVRTILCSKQ